MANTTKARLDWILVERGLCENRTRARALILAGKVRSGTEILDKPGRSWPTDVPLTVETPPRFVSRAGEKLAGFLDATGYDPAGCHILDIGASTGGFTDCLLQRGALDSTCVDVGRGQLHNKLLNDPRVTNLERLHAAKLPETTLPRTHYDWIVADLSFISLRKILPHIWPRLAPDGRLITLIKPQFEATREEADAGRGIIRDPAIRERVCREITEFATRELPGCEVLEQHASTLSGTDGNQEYLAAFRRKD